MAEPSIIIVGAGTGGLAAGCYARMNGYRTQVFERHSRSGGVCTSWKRKGYTFDGCMHHLAGCSASSPIHRLWRELGAMPRTIYYPEDLICVEGTDGRRFTVYIDLDRLHEHMLQLAPADAAVTGEFIAAARAFTRFSMMDMLVARPWQMLGMLPHLGLLGKWGKVTLEQYAQRFSDPFLRRAFPMIQYDFPDVPMLVLLMFLAGCSTHHLGWPAGGALEFARSIERRYLELGGEVRYNTAVDKVLVEGAQSPRGGGTVGGRGDRAVGVRLADGSEVRADAVISNADGHTTIYRMLDGRYTTPQIDTYYDQAPAEQAMSLHVSLGVARDLSAEPHALVLWLPEPISVGGEMHDRLDLELYAFAPEMAPAGKTVVRALFPAAYAYWRKLRDQGAAYDEEKQRIAEAVIAGLERRFPGLAQQVEAVDVATPLTTERYVGSYHGLQAWLVPNQSPLDVLAGKGLSRTLPGLQRFWMAGQWAAGLGLPNVAAVGRRTVEAICKADGRRFVATA